jgi:hypothetical protein
MGRGAHDLKIAPCAIEVRTSHEKPPATDQAVKIDPANFSDKIVNPLFSLPPTKVVVAGCSRMGRLRQL